MKLDPTWHWRAQYSLGLSDSAAITSAPHTLLLRAGRARHALAVVVEGRELLGQPRGALLGEHELQRRVALHDAGEDQVPQRPVRPPGHLEQEHDLGLGVVAVVGRRAAAVVVDGEAQLLAHRPQRLVVGGVQRRQARPGRRARQQHAAGQPGVRAPSAPRRPPASTSCSRICAMPARRPGAAAQKSASQRLWARRPAQRRSRSPAVGRRRLVHERRLAGRTAGSCSGR